MNGPFSLTPKGGLDKQVFIDFNGVQHNTTLYENTDRPQIVFNGDGSWFRGRHEVKFGASTRQVHGRHDGALRRRFRGLRARCRIQADRSDRHPTVTIQVNHAVYTSLFAGDTISADRLTINAAIRFDRATIVARTRSISTRTRSCRWICRPLTPPR